MLQVCKLICIIADHSKYKNVAYKLLLWTQKASELDLCTEALKTWRSDQCMKYGRLTQEVELNGSAQKDCTKKKNGVVIV